MSSSATTIPTMKACALQTKPTISTMCYITAATKVRQQMVDQDGKIILGEKERWREDKGVGDQTELDVGMVGSLFEVMM